MTTNPGRNLRRDEIRVKGIREAVLRHAVTEKECDSCVEKINKDEAYFRVVYKDPQKQIEMFHNDCFHYEFTNRPSRSQMLPGNTSEDYMQNYEKQGGDHGQGETVR